MSIQPHHPPCCTNTPSEQRESRYPSVAYTAEHHRLMRLIWVGAVTLHPDKHHLVLGVRVHPDVDLALSRLTFAQHAELAGEPYGNGRLAVQLTPLGSGVLDRWNTEHEDVGMAGGEL